MKLTAMMLVATYAAAQTTPRNVLKPDGALGDATNFPWKHTYNSADAVTTCPSPCWSGGGCSGVSNGNPGIVAADWNDQLFQQKCTGGWNEQWIEVELPSVQTCSKTAAVAYNKDHMMSTNPGAYVKASNDGFNWVTIASWDVHPGTSSLSDGVRPFLYHQSRAHPYNTIAGVEGGLDTWGIDLPGTTGYKFWRIGGGGSSSANWESQWFLLIQWVLICVDTPPPPPPPTGLALTDANAKIAFGPNAECVFEYKEGPPPYLESSCPVVSPDMPPSPPADPPSAPTPTVLTLAELLDSANPATQEVCDGSGGGNGGGTSQGTWSVVSNELVYDQPGSSYTSAKYTITLPFTFSTVSGSVTYCTGPVGSGHAEDSTLGYNMNGPFATYAEMCQESHGILAFGTETTPIKNNGISGSGNNMPRCPAVEVYTFTETTVPASNKFTFLSVQGGNSLEDVHVTDASLTFGSAGVV